MKKVITYKKINTKFPDEEIYLTDFEAKAEKSRLKKYPMLKDHIFIEKLPRPIEYNSEEVKILI